VVKPSRRTVLVGAALIAVLLIAGNVAGLVRYPGGPLSTVGGWFWLDVWGADQGTNGVGVSEAAGVTTGVPLYVGIFPRDQWPMAATIEGVRLVNPSQGLRLLEARLIRPGARPPNGAVGLVYGEGEQAEGLGLYTDYDPLPARLAGETRVEETPMWLAVVADQPGEQSFADVVVDYGLGPFTFTAYMHQSFSACIAPMPSGAVCSWDAR
jgi:hypothetical protein